MNNSLQEPTVHKYKINKKFAVIVIGGVNLWKTLFWLENKGFLSMDNFVHSVEDQCEQNVDSLFF